MITLAIPAPPSTNNLFINVRGRGRAKTSRYLTWLRAAGNELLAQRPGHISGPVSVRIKVRRRRKNQDIDNTIKAPLDLLVAHGVIDDDKCVHSVSAMWAPVDGAIVEVESLKNL